MNAIKKHRGATAAGKVAALLLLVVVVFQALLTLGAPWGAAAYGGANTGVLPDTLRASSAVTGVLYLALAVVAGTSWVSVRLRARFMYGTSALMVVAAVVNIASPSFIERIIWTPVTLGLVITLWRAARLDSAADTGHAARAFR
jgi:hypothetical protein